MICKIISTGSEIMNGTVVDTNSNYIMKKLYSLGIEVDETISISDKESRMFDTIKDSIEESDLIYIIGGLGPTDDDHTKNIVGKVLEKNLILREDLLRDLKYRYEKRSMPMPENNKKQALVLEGSIVLENKLGTAPGLLISDKGKKIFLFPGPPREMIPMFENSLNYIGLSTQSLNKIETINTIGIGESNLELLLKEIDLPKGLSVFTYPKDRRVDIQLLYKDNMDKELLSIYKDRLFKKLDSYIYGIDCESLEEIFLKLCLKKSIKIGIAESCTGGLVSSRLTDIPGASNVLERALVTYTKDAKMDELAVKKSTLDRHGAISPETAIEMAEGVKAKSGADLGLSITGVAGPGKEENKKEGLVYIGISYLNQTYSEKFEFNGTRMDIKKLASSQCFIEGIKAIEKRF